MSTVIEALKCTLHENHQLLLAATLVGAIGAQNADRSRG